MNSNQNWFNLSAKSIKNLFIYYGLLIFFGLITTTIFLIDLNSKTKLFELTIFSSALFSAISMSILACSISYTRKLYKSCINIEQALSENKPDSIKQFGVLAYFILRPIFAGALCLLLIIILKAGLSGMTKSEELTEKFVYLSVFFGFFTGYSIGDIIDIIEEKGKKIVTNLFNNPKL